jgi:hypothetical protein
VKIKTARWGYAFAAAILVLAFYALVAWRSLWGFLLQIAQPAAFGDLRVVTSAAGCYNRIASLDFVGNTCASWLTISGSYPAEPYNYPAFWAKTLAMFGVSDKSLFLMGMIFITLFAISIGILVRIATDGNNSIWVALTLLVLSFSPAATLALERGNFDVLVFSTVVLGSYLATRGKPVMAGFFIAVASVLKIFPIGSLSVVFIDSKRRKSAIFVTLGTLILGFLLIIGDLPHILSRTPQSSQASFGISVLPLAVAKILGLPLSTGGARLFGFALFLIFLTAILLVERKFSSRIASWSRQLATTVARDGNSQILVTVGLGAFTVAYLLGANWDYRAIFLIVAAAGFSRLALVTWKSAWPVLALISIVVLNTAQGVDNLFNFLGDGILLVLAPYFAILTFRVVRLNLSKDLSTQTKN